MAYFNGKKVFNAPFTSLYDEGHQDGYEEGYQNGYNTGGSEGYRVGQQEGITHTCQVLNEVLLADDMPSVSIPSSLPDGIMPPEPLQEAMEDVYLCAAARWDADTQQGETLTFQRCKGGRFSGTEEYGLRVVGKTAQEGTPTPAVPLPIRCVKAGTKIVCGESEAITPCDLYEGDIWWPMTGKVERNTQLFTLPVSEMNNSEDYPGWKNVSEIRDCVGADRDVILADEPLFYSNVGKIGMGWYANTKSGNSILFAHGNGITQSGLMAQYPDVVCAFLLQRLAPLVEQYDPQPLVAPAGTATVTQSATDLPATLSATLAVERG